ncbi:MAG: hypothetical protein KBS56_00005, partial [Clostridiales bacterium]|nr:hypothetical protein [Candidatus Crickella equi]
ARGKYKKTTSTITDTGCKNLLIFHCPLDGKQFIMRAAFVLSLYEGRYEKYITFDEEKTVNCRYMGSDAKSTSSTKPIWP